MGRSRMKHISSRLLSRRVLKPAMLHPQFVQSATHLLFHTLPAIPPPRTQPPAWQALLSSSWSVLLRNIKPGSIYTNP